MVEVTESVLERLLDPVDPALRYRVLRDILEHGPDDPQVASTRKRIPEQPWIRATLAAHHGDGTWGRGFYHKYDGTSWVLLHLSELGAPMDHPAIRAGVHRLLHTARPVESMRGARAEPFRGLTGGYYWEHPIACLTAHMALVLIRAGESGHEVTRGALDICRHRFEPDLGFGCMVVEDSLIPACVMTVPKVLKAFLALPAGERTDKDRALIDGMVAVLKRFHLYRYVPDQSKAWASLARTLPPARRRDEKRRWIAIGRADDRGEKDGWLRFSFPHSYNSDLLEVLLLLGEAGVERDAVIDDGLAILVKKRGKDGMWKMIGGLNGKMHAALDARGRSSPWITWRALLALKRFGALRLPPGRFSGAGPTPGLPVPRGAP